MKIKKGMKLEITHTRKGYFHGTAVEDFDTVKDFSFPIETTEKLHEVGLVWWPGARITCYSSFCTIEVIKEKS